MTVSDLLTQQLAGKKISADVEYYDSIVCSTKYAKNQELIIKHITLFDDGENTVYGVISTGDNEGKECNFNISLEYEFNFLS